MRIALVDDSAEERGALRQMLEDRLSVHMPLLSKNSKDNIRAFSSGEDFLDVFSAKSFDLICLDIYMKELSGIDTAKKIRESDKDVPIVFITTSNDFASESYAVHASFYLLKPYTDSDVDRMLETVLPSIAASARVLELSDGTRIPVDSILYADSQGHYASFHLRGGREQRIRINHADLEKMLSPFDCFCSCSRGILVNFQYVEGFTSDQIILTEGLRIPVSRRRYAATKQEFADYTFRQLQQM